MAMTPPLLCLLAACTGSSPDKSPADRIKETVDSFVFAGDLARADSAFRVSLAQAPDSDSYYETLAIGTSLDYYNARLDSLDDKAGRIEAYAAANPGSERRDKALFNALQAKAASFVQYRFDSDSSIYYMERAIEVAGGIEDRHLLLLAYSNIGDALKNAGHFDRSMEYYIRGVALADSIGADRNARLPLYMGMAADFTSLRDFDNSAVWWDKAADMRDVMSFNDLFQYYNNRGNDYYYGKQYAKALDSYLELGKMLGDRPEYDWERHFCRANLSDVYLRLGMPEKAAELIDENLRYFTETQPNDYAATHVMTQKIDWLMMTGQTAAALDMLRSHPLAPDTRPEQLSLRLELEKKIYPAVGDWQRAFEAQNAWQALEDSIRNSQVRMNIETIRRQYEHDAQMKDLRTAAEEKIRQLFYSYIIIILAVVLLAALTAVAILSRRMARDREDKMIRKIMSLRMKGLRNRLTPHFIYNILNNELGTSHASGESGISRLVHLLRQQQIMADEITATLAEELDFVDNYVALRGETQPSGVAYTKSIAEGIDPGKVLLPSMSLQIFVENAFKHGFSTLPPDAPRILEIKADESDGRICLTVCNNAAQGHTSPSGAESTRQGLKIISGTLQILNDRKDRKILFSLTDWTDSPTGAGTAASLSIPCGFPFPPSSMK